MVTKHETAHDLQVEHSCEYDARVCKWVASTSAIDPEDNTNVRMADSFIGQPSSPVLLAAYVEQLKRICRKLMKIEED